MLLDLGNKDLYAEYSKEKYNPIFYGVKSKRRVRCKNSNSLLLKLLTNSLNEYVECVKYLCGYADTGHEIYALMALLGLVNIGKLSYELQEAAKGREVDLSAVSVHNVREVLRKYSNNNSLLDHYIQALNGERNTLVHQLPAIEKIHNTISKMVNPGHAKKIALLLRTYSKFLQSAMTAMKMSPQIIQSVLLSEEEIVVTVCRFVAPQYEDVSLLDYSRWLEQRETNADNVVYCNKILEQFKNQIKNGEQKAQGLNTIAKYNNEIQSLQVRIQQLNTETNELLKVKEQLQKEVQELQMSCAQYKPEEVLEVQDEENSKPTAENKTGKSSDLAQGGQMFAF